MAKLQKVDIGDNCTRMCLVAPVVGYNSLTVVLVRVADQQDSRRRELALVEPLQELDSLIVEMTGVVPKALMQRKGLEELAICEKDRTR